MMLTAEERRRFADYLELDADQSEGLAAQMDKLPGGMDVIAKKHRDEAKAARIVAKRLRSVEEFTVEGKRHA